MARLLSKKEIRDKLLMMRKNLSSEELKHFSELVSNKIQSLKEYKEARMIMSYIAKNKEVRTRELIENSIAMGKKVTAPKVDLLKKNIKLHEIRDFDNDLVPGFKGILEPKSSLPVIKNLKEIEFALIPGVAFDRKGRRIGFGKGFFDKLLMNKTNSNILCGIAFDFQILDEIPFNSDDIAMDIIVSDKRIIRC